ncbi:unnamed protein product, partial [Bubo scandiacus]
PSSLAMSRSPLVCICSVINCDVSDEPSSYAVMLWCFLILCYLACQTQKSLHTVIEVTRDMGVVLKEAGKGYPYRIRSVEREDGKGLLNMKKKALTSCKATRLEK